MARCVHSGNGANHSLSLTINSIALNFSFHPISILFNKRIFRFSIDLFNSQHVCTSVLRPQLLESKHWFPKSILVLITRHDMDMEYQQGQLLHVYRLGNRKMLFSIQYTVDGRADG